MSVLKKKKVEHEVKNINNITIPLYFKVLINKYILMEPNPNISIYVQINLVNKMGYVNFKRKWNQTHAFING